MKKNWKWYGNAGHFCNSRKCRFHMCTEVGDYLVSTVGEYYPHSQDTMETLGAGANDFYETYVFKILDSRCSCGCGLPHINLSEIKGVKYVTPKEANEGHMAMCEKYDT